MSANPPNGDGRALVHQQQPDTIQPRAEQPVIVQIKPGAIDPKIIAKAAAFHAAAGGKITKEQALAAAIHFAETGEVNGRESYLSTEGKTAGRVIEGYRALTPNRPHTVKYRTFTVDENTAHGIQPGDRALACEVYVLDDWKEFQRAGLPYQPVVGIAVYRKGSDLRVPTGKTERWVLEKAARKDAFRQIPDMAADEREVLEDVAAEGGQLPPAGVRLNDAQARAWQEYQRAEAARAAEEPAAAQARAEQHHAEYEERRRQAEAAFDDRLPADVVEGEVVPPTIKPADMLVTTQSSTDDDTASNEEHWRRELARTQK